MLDKAPVASYNEPVGAALRTTAPAVCGERTEKKKWNIQFIAACSVQCVPHRTGLYGGVSGSGRRAGRGDHRHPQTLTASEVKEMRQTDAIPSPP